MKYILIITTESGNHYYLKTDKPEKEHDKLGCHYVWRQESGDEEELEWYEDFTYVESVKLDDLEEI